MDSNPILGQNAIMIIRNKKRGFEIKRGNFTLGGLDIPKWYSMNGSSNTAQGSLEIKCKETLSSTNIYSLDGRERGQLTSDWKRNMTISIDWQLNGSPTNYRIGKSGFWSNTYEVEENNNVLFSLIPKWSWSTWSYEYEVEVLEEMPEEKLIELLIYAVHAARVQAANQAAMS